MNVEDCEYLRSFPCHCEEADECICAGAHARLREAHRFWHDALHRYYDPDAFRSYLNGAIQALRNVTFALQSSKSNVNDFDDWYRPWQDAFRTDFVMRWAVESRNQIVKASDLQTRSRAKATLLGSINGKPTEIMETEPSLANSEICDRLMRWLTPTHRLLRDGIISIERRWCVDELGDIELLEALVHIFSRLSQLLAAYHEQFGVAQTSMWQASSIAGQPLAPSNEAILKTLVPPCMVSFDDSRTSWIRTVDGDEIVLARRRIQDQDLAKSLEFAKAHYGDSPFESLRKTLSASSLVERGRAYWDVAKQLMQKDGYHRNLVHLYRNGRPVQQCSMEFPDNAAKLLFWDELARQVSRTGATELIAISERWLAIFDPSDPDQRASDAPNRREILGVDGLNALGDSVSIFGFVDRLSNGQTSVGEPRELRDEQLYYLDEVRRVWGLPLGKQMKEVKTSLVRYRSVFPVSFDLKGTSTSRRMKVGRNQPCPCGSGRKFKHFHGT